MLEALRCRFCTGFINPRTYTCEYCGTVYMKPRNSFDMPTRELIVVREAPVETISAQIALPYEAERYMGDREEEYVRSQLSEQFVDYIKPRMGVEKNDDFIHMNKIYRGRLRVVKPGFKWGT